MDYGNRTYTVVKDIKLQGGGSIKKNSMLQFTHGLYYLDGGLLPGTYQADFASLVEHEGKVGWNYLRPRDFSAITNNF